MASRVRGLFSATDCPDDRTLSIVRMETLRRFVTHHVVYAFRM